VIAIVIGDCPPPITHRDPSPISWMTVLDDLPDPRNRENQKDDEQDEEQAGEELGGHERCTRDRRKAENASHDPHYEKQHC
jgi:hypothetical protein